jgi:hypothetical protein
MNHDVNMYFATGNPEKKHGWFFYMALFVLFFLLKSVSSEERRNLLYTSFAGFIGVIIYVVFQKIWLDPLAPFYETRLDPRRAFSTLGNPNYLAGFILIMLPTSSRDNICTQGWTQGFLGYHSLGRCSRCYLFDGELSRLDYFLRDMFSSYCWNTLCRKRNIVIFFGFLSLWLGFLAGILFWQEYGRDVLEMQKMKWFIARWYLWKTGIAALFHDVPHFLFWFGPDGFLPVSEYFRHPLLSIYEDPAYRIDRSHNVFIDAALHFGVPITVALLVLIGRQIPHISHGKRVALFMFALYFSFNIPVLIHFLIVLQILTYPETSGRWWTKV